jgi:uncharacterized membrane protein YhaH (DUF805 family)
LLAVILLAVIERSFRFPKQCGGVAELDQVLFVSSIFSADARTRPTPLIHASLPFALWGIVELDILAGTKGPNRYDADPTQPQA